MPVAERKPPNSIASLEAHDLRMIGSPYIFHGYGGALCMQRHRLHGLRLVPPPPAALVSSLQPLRFVNVCIKFCLLCNVEFGNYMEILLIYGEAVAIIVLDNIGSQFILVEEYSRLASFVGSL